MLVRPAHRPRPAVAALVAGLLLACGFLMWGAGAGAGQAGTMDAAPHRATSAMAPYAAAAVTAADGPDDDCPSMAGECPLASAQLPASAAVAAPLPAAMPPVLVGPGPSSWASAVACARPRAPDPVSLLCVSRT
ncbi:hypothetical protein ACFTWH_24000 [Streptomyces sp. NPDC057011]|uniref:hypothetical protein n=1 Tax=unclassified Streptomyces TaxID=2593676 RepID=UPI003632D817